MPFNTACAGITDGCFSDLCRDAALGSLPDHARDGQLLFRSVREHPPLSEETLVSIVTPTLNRADSIGDVLASVAAQTHGSIEHIIVDGGSTDGTVEVVERFSRTARYPIRWISEPDTGMYDAINKGLRMARGDVVAYLNSDDLYFPWSVETAVRTLQEGCDFVFGDVAISRRPTSLWVFGCSSTVASIPATRFIICVSPRRPCFGQGPRWRRQDRSIKTFVSWEMSNTGCAGGSPDRSSAVLTRCLPSSSSTRRHFPSNMLVLSALNLNRSEMRTRLISGCRSTRRCGRRSRLFDGDGVSVRSGVKRSGSIRHGGRSSSIFSGRLM